MKVLGIITSLINPASRARILQYSDAFKQKNITITPRYFYPADFSDPAPWAYRLKKITGISEWRYLWIHKMKSRLPLFIEQYKYDLIWQNRLIVPHHSFFERNLSKPIVFDYDDAIWLEAGEKKVAEAIAAATIVFAGNEYLADFANKHNKNIAIIPSTINTETLFPKSTMKDTFTIGWVGSHYNLKYLDIVKPSIDTFLSENKDARFMVVSSEQPQSFNFDNKQYTFKKWSAEDENDLINEFSIGIMPLLDNAFTQGKCSYKMLQCLACGKPVVVSPVGLNSKLLSENTIGLPALTENDWLVAFKTLKYDTAFYDACSENGVSLVEKNYSLKKYTPIIIEHFNKLVK